MEVLSSHLLDSNLRDDMGCQCEETLRPIPEMRAIRMAHAGRQARANSISVAIFRSEASLAYSLGRESTRKSRGEPILTLEEATGMPRDTS